MVRSNRNVVAHLHGRNVRCQLACLRPRSVPFALSADSRSPGFVKQLQTMQERLTWPAFASHLDWTVYCCRGWGSISDKQGRGLHGTLAPRPHDAAMITGRAWGAMRAAARCRALVAFRDGRCIAHAGVARRGLAPGSQTPGVFVAAKQVRRWAPELGTMRLSSNCSH